VEGSWVLKQLEASGKSQADLARYLQLAPPVVNKMIKGRRVIKATEADQIRAFFRMPNADTGSAFPQPRNADSRIVRHSVIDANITPPLRSEMARDVPILGTVSGGAGTVQFNGEPIDWARRPPRLAGRTDVFGLYVEDLSMVPAFRPGALILVERVKPPAPGDDVVMDLSPEKPGDDQRALIKHLVAITPTLVRVAQHNPPKELEIPRKQVIRLYRVMTMADLLGV
jgi:phage repressor protein C with HTH and peptisase S24 domain